MCDMKGKNANTLLTQKRRGNKNIIYKNEGNEKRMFEWGMSINKKKKKNAPILAHSIRSDPKKTNANKGQS